MDTKHISVICLLFLFTVFLKAEEPILKRPELLEKNSSNIFLTMKTSADLVFERINAANYSDSVTKTEAMVNELQSLSSLSQTPIQTFLIQLGTVEFKTFWISNQIYIKDANPFLIRALLVNFAPLLSGIDEEQVLKMLPTFEVRNVETRALGTPEWGVEQLDVHKAWGNGAQGQDVTVAVIDSGINAGHQDFSGASISWRDALAKTPAPIDTNGHGSHCSGTIAGRNGVGVAPKASLACCRACDSVCPQSALLECGQWVTCPNAGISGGPLNCTNKPQVVSNSWGGTGGQTWFDSVIRAWRTANIVPVFAAGNSGPSCSTVGSPGDNSEVISVAANDINRKCASFSSRGPSVKEPNQLKPDISAPGVKVVSCSNVLNTGYKSMSGTSMACPHIAGLVAVLLSHDPNLTFQQIAVALIKSSDTNMDSTGGVTCGGTSATNRPNYNSGFGIPDAGKAMALLN